jgi:starvation-inducible DNA-binding protein
MLADMFALYLKTKNFHWHMSGPHFRDYHLMLDEQADQIFATTDAIAERARKVGGSAVRSIGHIGRLQRLRDNDSDFVTPCCPSFKRTILQLQTSFVKPAQCAKATMMWRPPA